MVWRSSPFSGVLGVFRLQVVCCRFGFLFASSFGGSAGSSPRGVHRLIFSHFLSTFGVFLSTFGVFLSTYSLVFACISRIFFVTLQYSYKVSVMFDQDLYQDDFLDAMDDLVEGLSGSLFRVSVDSVSDRQVH